MPLTIKPRIKNGTISYYTFNNLSAPMQQLQIYFTLIICTKLNNIDNIKPISVVWKRHDIPTTFFPCLMRGMQKNQTRQHRFFF